MKKNHYEEDEEPFDFGVLEEGEEDYEPEEEAEQRVQRYNEQCVKNAHKKRLTKLVMVSVAVAISVIVLSLLCMGISDTTRQPNEIGESYPDENIHSLYDSCEIKRCINAKTHEMESSGFVKYHVNEDTLFMDRHFHFVSIIYSAPDGKMDTSGRAQSPVIHENDKKGDWWYAVIRRSTLHPQDYKVTGIVCRALYVENEHESHIVSDAYLYNKTNGISRDKTVGEPTTNIKKLLNMLNQ